MSFDTTLKGFQNPIGHNNCFLNVGLQSLWHLAPFHLQFVAQKTHLHDPECCLFCSLKLIFDQYKYGDSNSLPPTVIRNDLSYLFAKDSKFQIGQLDDAAEALESLLTTLHNQITQKSPESLPEAPDAACEPPCLVHRVFGIGVVQQTCCPHCAATSEPFLSNALIDYIPVAALRSSATEASLSPRPSSFSELLRRARSGHDQRKCTNDECGKQAPLLQYLITRPAVYSVGLVWESDESPMGDIMSTLDLIGLELDTRGLYHQSEGEQCLYKLKGMVCYYGKHYIAYFYSVSRGCWIGFDDVIVTEVGPHWSNVLSKCKRGKDQPSLLFYEKVDYSSPYNESPVSTPNTTPRGVMENGNGTNSHNSAISPRGENGSSSLGNGMSSLGNGIEYRQNSNGVVENNSVAAGDLINFSAQNPSRPPPPSYMPATSYYGHVIPHTLDSHVYSQESSHVHRLTNKISQKIHGTSSSNHYSNTTPTTNPYGLSSLAPSTRGSSTVHTPGYSALPPSYTSSLSYTSPTPNYATSNPSTLSSGYSTTNPSLLYYRSSAATTPSSFTHTPSTTSSTAASALRNGSPQRQRPDPFSALLANSSLPSSAGATRSASASQRPTDPPPPTTSQYTSPTRGISPAHQRPSPSYVSPSTRGVSPSHQRPADYTSPTRGTSPAHQRPLDYYSNKGLSASRTSAYPPAPTLNSTATSTTSSVTRSSSTQRVPSYDHLYSGVSPTRSAPDPPSQVTTPSSINSSATRGVSPARRPVDPSPPPSSIYANGKIARNPSPARSSISLSSPSSITSPTRTQIAQSPTTSPATPSTSSIMSKYIRQPAARSSLSDPPPYSSTTTPSNTYSNNTTPTSSSSIYSSSATTPSSSAYFTATSTAPSSIYSTPSSSAYSTATSTAAPSSIYSSIDKSGYSTSSKYQSSNNNNNNSSIESLDKEVESYLQNMRLADPTIKPIPASAPPPRYTSPKRTYPSDANYTTSYLNGTHSSTISGKMSPSSFYRGGSSFGAKKSVTFQM